MKYLTFLALVGLIFLNACSHPESDVMVKFNGRTQGTYYVLTYFDQNARNFQPQVDSILKVIDQSVSLWEPASVISGINREDKGVEPDKIFLELFRMSQEVYEKSDGAFDPTVGPVVNAWGFGFTDRQKVDQHIVDSLLPLVGFNKVKLENDKIIKTDPRIQFDFNAIAQGYAVDLLGKFLQDKMINNFLIDIGGEVLAKGTKPGRMLWKVGIEKPSDNAGYGESLQAIVNLENKALATSGNYRKFYEENGIRYSHTIDPKTGYPVRHSLLSVSVLSSDCATADAYATVFMVMGLEKSKTFLATHGDLEAYFIYTNNDGNLTTYFSKGFDKVLENTE